MAVEGFDRGETVVAAWGRFHGMAGVVHGASDESAAYPTESPHDPADMAATIYHLLGIPAETILYDAQRRPHHLVIGRVIDQLVT